MFCYAELSALSSFGNHNDGEETTGRLTLIVFLMSCDCKFLVAIPHGSMGWSAVCDCGILHLLFRDRRTYGHTYIH